MKTKIKTLEIIGRILFTTTFIVAIPPKIFKFPIVLDVIISKGISQFISTVLLIGAINCLLFGSLFFLLGKERLGSSLLLIFLVPTTLIFHTLPFDAQSFFMNIGLIGALVLFVSKYDMQTDLMKTKYFILQILSDALKFLRVEISKLIK